MTIPSPLGRALAEAVARVRALAGDPVAPVVVLTPSEANGTLARQQLALAGDFVRVDFAAPERVVRELGHRALVTRGLRPEPSGWLGATVGAVVEDLAAREALGRYGVVLRQPGWRGALARAVETLESAGVGPDALERVVIPEHADRLTVLARVLRGVAVQRGADRLYALADLCAAARANVGGGRWAGAVVLGDRLLAPQVHEVLAAWLSGRPHLEVRPHPWRELPPAPNGLRAATSGAALDVPRPDQRQVLVRTPDDVREIHEAVREVADAVRAGVPLDRIAVVLPDPAQVEVLREDLLQAGIPATWLVGPPLASTPAGGFLLHALDVAAGADTVPAWYDLLRQPGLRLKSAVGADVVEGRGRWRRILSRCGAVCRTDVIRRAIEAWAADAEPDQRPAATNLSRAIGALDHDLVRLREPATLGEHANRWVALVRRWWGPSPDREQVLALLSGWGAAGVGAPYLVREALEGAAALSGTLSDPAIRVTSPMGLLGGAFERVVATGLVEGRFPRRPDEDPLLPDALLAALNAALGCALADSRSLRAFEERRFAAVVSSCTSRLWLSSPATELLEERPLLPSGFVLDLASVQLGRRAGYRDLPQVQVIAGTRARPWPDDPARAVGPLEHRIATAAADRPGGLRRLARHATGRRLLGLLRALDQPHPTRWTGRLDPAGITVPGLDGSAVSTWTVASLLRNPAAFLVDEVLGVRSPPALHGRSDPTSTWFQVDQVRRALVEALESAGEPADAADGADGRSPSEALRASFLAAWDEALAAWRRHRADVDDPVIRLIRSLAALRLEGAIAGGAIPSGARAASEGRLSEDLPWVVRADAHWVHDGCLTELRSRHRPAARQLARDATGLVLSGLVTPGVQRLRVCVVDGGQAQDGDLASEQAALAEPLEVATRRAQAGFWPWNDPHPVKLAAERDYEPDPPEEETP